MDRNPTLKLPPGVKLLQRLDGGQGMIRSVAFDPQGGTLASGGDHSVKLWDVRSGKLIRLLEGHVPAARGLAFDPQGVTLASGGGDRIVRLWDVSSGKLLRTFEGHNGMVTSVAFDLWLVQGKIQP
jgi:WD40 repeat protein